MSDKRFNEYGEEVTNTPDRWHEADCIGSEPFPDYAERVVIIWDLSVNELPYIDFLATNDALLADQLREFCDPEICDFDAYFPYGTGEYLFGVVRHPAETVWCEAGEFSGFRTVGEPEIDIRLVSTRFTSREKASE